MRQVWINKSTQLNNSSLKLTKVNEKGLETLKDNQNFGVPKFLVNKWLNVECKKSKFVEKR